MINDGNRCYGVCGFELEKYIHSARDFVVKSIMAPIMALTRKQ